MDLICTVVYLEDEEMCMDTPTKFCGPFEKFAGLSFVIHPRNLT